MQSTDYSDQRLKLLLVDPSPTEQHMMLSVLNLHNWDACIAEDIDRGLKLAREQRPNLIIAELGLRMDGAELCRQVRQDQGLADIPVVLMSSYAHTGQVSLMRLFEAGCDQVIQKPFKPKELHAAICLAMKRSERDRLIPVLHRTGEFALVTPSHLDQLISEKKILCFRRQEAVAFVERDSIRKGGGSIYGGPERRLDT